MTEYEKYRADFLARQEEAKDVLKQVGAAIDLWEAEHGPIYGDKLRFGVGKSVKRAPINVR